MRLRETFGGSFVPDPQNQLNSGSTPSRLSTTTLDVRIPNSPDDAALSLPAAAVGGIRQAAATSITIHRLVCLLRPSRPRLPDRPNCSEPARFDL